MVRRLLPAVLVLSLLLAPAGAAASWKPAGAGGAYSRASSLTAGATPTASVSGRNVTVSWAPSGSVPVGGYALSRYNTAGTFFAVGAACSGTLAATNCTEQDVAVGEWRYTVIPVLGNWRGAESARSVAVKVEAPKLALAQSTVSSLPATLSGELSGFLEAQTVTYRLDNPTTGTVLSATTTPATLPASGAAAVSVTVPTGTADGSHTIYAVGSRGDVAQATITVAAACTAPGSRTISASQDAYVDSLFSGTNFGATTTLEVGPSYLLILGQQRALVKFELPAVPARCSLVEATLRLYATTPGAGRTIEALRAGAAWTETGITWANQPASAGAAANSASLSTAGFQAWEVLTQVKAMYSEANNGFLVKDSAASGVLPPHQIYQSREGTPDSQDPQLVLTFG